MTSYSELQTAAVVEIRLAGLDPDVIRVRGADYDGYDEFMVDAHGKRIIDGNGVAVTIRKSWPAAFGPGGHADLDRVLRLVDAWENMDV